MKHFIILFLFLNLVYCASIPVYIYCNFLDALIKKIGLLKRNCFASVFERYFDFLEKEEDSKETAVIHYREDETMYVEAKADRITVIFSTVFKDAHDVIIGKVFMQVTIVNLSLLN